MSFCCDRKLHFKVSAEEHGIRKPTQYTSGGSSDRRAAGMAKTAAAASWWRNSRWASIFVALSCMSVLVLAASAERSLMLRDRRAATKSKAEMDELQRLITFLKQPNLSAVYQRAWPASSPTLLHFSPFSDRPPLFSSSANTLKSSK